MKVLFIALELYNPRYLGGIQRFNQRVVRTLLEFQGDLVQAVRTIALWDTPEDTSRAPAGAPHYAGQRKKLRTALRFFRDLHTFRPDVVLYGHVLLAPLSVAARVVRPEAKNLLFVHGVEVWGVPFRRMPPWERAAIRIGCHSVIAVSRLTSERMERAYRIGSHRYRILPCAIDYGKLPSGCGLNQVPTGSSVLLTVARLAEKDRGKGIDKVLHALPSVLSRFPNVQYVIVGDGPLKDELAALAKRLGVHEHVRFLGRVSDAQLPELYSSASIFVMPSSQEGFGIVYLEAWAHGVPVIAGKHDAGGEVVTHELNGFTVDPDSPGELAEAITWLLAHPAEARAMGQAGYETVKRHYTHERFRERLAEILQESVRAVPPS